MYYTWRLQEWHESVIQLLLESGVDINAVNSHHSTALTLAAEYGHVQTCKILISDRSIDVNIRDADGDTALIAAACKGHEGIIELLLMIDELDPN
jgi:ankyrin repeat protein